MNKPYLDTNDRMDHYHPHAKSSLDDELLARVRVEPRGKLLEFTVYGIDGEAMRTKDVDFTTGGNPARYRYVPNGELWVERFLPPSDVAPVYIHEGFECVTMVSAGKSYDDAHDLANAHEYGVRQAIAQGRIVIATFEDALKFANIYLMRAFSV